MNMKFKRGDKVNYDPHALPSEEQKQGIENGSIMDLTKSGFRAATGTFVWTWFAHLMEWGYVIEHPEGHPKKEFLAKPPFKDGFESIHSSELEDGKKYIYAGAWQLELWRPRIYMASKTKHRKKWIDLITEGHNIISSWIYAEGDADRNVLCFQCKHECLKCDGLVLYAEEGETLHDALIEAGIVLASGLKKVVLVGHGFKKDSLFRSTDQVIEADTVEEAISIINKYAEQKK